MVHHMIEFKDFLDDAQVAYLDNIRDGHPHAFTRHRKTNPYQLMLQMFAQKGQSQFSELLNFYKDQDQPLDISTVGFYKARMHFNPKALPLMMADYMKKIYQQEDNDLVKFKGDIVTAIDGSDITLPNTEENAALYGMNHDANRAVSPVIAKLSLVYDCINHLVIDTRIDRYKASERALATQHLDALKSTLDQPTLTIFDRGYFSMRLVDQMLNQDQKFVMRLNANYLKRYSDQLDSGEDCTFNMTFDRRQTAQYRYDPPFRATLRSTTYPLRMVKLPITQADTGHTYDEILLTNLTPNECSMAELKELYHLRWEIETAYNVLKNRMKLAEFSGKREWLIRQDIYCCVWLYNLIMLIIMEGNRAHEIPQERYTYTMKRNINVAIGVVKTYFIQAVMSDTEAARNAAIDQMNQLILNHLVPVRPNRTSPHQTSVNQSRMAYRYTY